MSLGAALGLVLVAGLAPGRVSPAAASVSPRPVEGVSVRTAAPGEPSGACDWYGSWSYSHDFDDAVGQPNSNVVRERLSVASVGGAGDCAADYEYSYSQRNQPCNNRDANASGLSSYQTFPTTFSVYTTPAAPYSVSRDCDQGSYTLDGLPSVLCDIPAEHEDAAQRIQAVVLTCTEEQSSETFRQSWTSQIRMRRLECDPTVDTDGGGVSDCEEYELGTDTFDSADDRDCESRIYSSFSDYHARHPWQGVSQAPEPHLGFSVTSEWCISPGGGVTVISVEPRGRTLGVDSYWDVMLEEQVRFWFSQHNRWKTSGHAVAGDVVTASGTFESCYGIPLLGSAFKLTKRLPKMLRFLADHLRRADGRLGAVAGAIAKAARKAADAAEWALERGGRAARWTAKQAMKVFRLAVDALSQRLQRKVFVFLAKAVAERNAVTMAGTWFLSSFAEVAAERAPGGASDLLSRFLSDTLVCVPGWKPQIRQTLGSLPASSTFVDREGDVDWVVHEAGAVP